MIKVDVSDKVRGKIEKALQPLVFDDVSLNKITEDGIEAEMEFDMDLLNYKGGMHGGMIFTFADLAAGMTMLVREFKVTTLQGSMNYIKEGLVGPIYAKTKILHSGRTTSVIEVEIKDGNMALMAKGTFTMFVLEKL